MKKLIQTQLLVRQCQCKVIINLLFCFVDISDFIPRRSSRKARQQVGHRTELGTFTTPPSHWDSEEVAEFLRQQGFSEYAQPFLQCGIDGQSLFLLKEHHLFERFKMNLGPALCLLDIVSKLKHPPIAQ